MSLKSSETELSFTHMLGMTMLALGLSVGLSACSISTDEMLDAANPANWFEDDETVPGDEIIPGVDDTYPNLGSVPNRPVEPEIRRDYETLASGLIADTKQAKYTDERLRSQAVPDVNLTLLQAQELPDPDTPIEPPVVKMVADAPLYDTAESTTSLSTTTATTPAPLPAPTAEPLTVPSAEQLISQQASQPPADATGIVAQSLVPETSAPETSAPETSANVMPSQNAVAVLTPKLTATIYFADGSASLTDADEAVVAQVVTLYEQGGGKAIFITGHSSSPAKTNDQLKAGLVNFKMSLNRGIAVADTFHAYGIARSRISVEARGSKNPRYVESNEAGIAGNRRAEIYIGY